MSEFDPEMRLDEARDLLHQKIDGGVTCPCCDQFAKVYKRKLNAKMVRLLAAMLDAGGDKSWVHSQKVANEYGIGQVGGDAGKIAYFQLIREHPDEREDGGKSGLWKVTPEGVDFLRGEIGVAKYAIVYNNEVLDFDGETVYVNDVAPQFDLRELMAGV